jgi:hypothetical protein
MTWRQTAAGRLVDPPPAAGDRRPVAYLIGSRDKAVLAEVISQWHARRLGPNLVIAELTAAEADAVRREYAGRAVVAPDAPMSPFGS